MTTKEKREKRGALATQMSELAGTPTPENMAKFDQIDAEQKQLKVEIDNEERAAAAVTTAAALEAEMRSSRRPPNGDPNGGGDGDDTTQEAQAEAYASAFRNYLRYGLETNQYQSGVTAEERALLLTRRRSISPISGVEQRAGVSNEGGPPFGAYPGSTTGFFVPVGFVNKVESALKWYGDMLNVATILETATGQPLPYPTDNDTTQTGALLAESSPVATSDVSISMIMLGAFKFTTNMVKVSIEMLQDSAFDIDAFLSQKFGIRLGRILNTKFTIGVGTTEPLASSQPRPLAWLASLRLVVTPLSETTTRPRPIRAIRSATSTWSTLSTAWTRRTVIAAKYMMHDQTLRFIKTLKDKYGHPLWVPGIASGAPDTILSYKYSINNDMAHDCAECNHRAFGALDKYWCAGSKTCRSCAWLSGLLITGRSRSSASRGTTATCSMPELTR